MPPVSDLVDLSRLDVHVAGDLRSTVQKQYVRAHGTQPHRHHRGNLIETTWRRERTLGQGGGGIVYLEKCTGCSPEIAQGRIGQLRAVKRLQKQKDADYYRELEAVALFSLERFRESFVESFGWYDTEDFVFVTMEYLSHGDLQTYLNSPFPEAEVQCIMSQVVEALAFMHERDFTHRDLKPGNIMVSRPGPEWWVKVADFGISKRARDGTTQLRTQVYTPAFAAPEVLHLRDLDLDDDSDETLRYTNAVDMWAAGMVACVMLVGRGVVHSQRLRKFITGSSDRFPSDIFTGREISGDGRQFLQALLSIAPTSRPSANACLEHEWLRCVPIAGSPVDDGSNDVASTLPDPRIEDTFVDTESSSTNEGQMTEERLAHWTTDSSPAVNIDSKIEEDPKCEDIAMELAEQRTERLVVIELHDDPQPSMNDSIELTQRAKPADSSSIREDSPVSATEDLIRYSPAPPRLTPDALPAERANLTEPSPINVMVEGRLELQLAFDVGDRVLTMDYSPNGDLLAMGLDTGDILVGNIETKESRRLQGHKSAVTSVTFSQGGHVIVSGSVDSTIKVWDTAIGHTRQTLHTSGEPTSLIFSPNGNLTAWAYRFGGVFSVSRWEEGVLGPFASFDLETSIVFLDFSLDSQSIACVLNLGKIVVVNYEKWAIIATTKIPSNAVSGVGSRGGRLLVCGMSDGRLLMWTKLTAKPQHALSGGYLGGFPDRVGVRDIAITRDARLLASIPAHGTVRLWDSSFSGPSSLEEVGVIRCDTVRNIALSPHGKQIALATDDHNVIFLRPYPIEYNAGQGKDDKDRELAAAIEEEEQAELAKERNQASSAESLESPETSDTEHPKGSFLTKLRRFRHKVGR